LRCRPPFVVVVPLLVEPNVMVVPSTTMDSFEPSCMPVTVKVNPVMDWPVESPPTAVALKTVFAAP